MPTRFPFEVQPRIPERLDKLNVLAGDLFYSWERSVRGLFSRLDSELWEECGHNPRVFLRRVSQQRLDEAADDRGFIEDYNRVLSVHDSYSKEGMRAGVEQYLDPHSDLIAYFCAEFGFYESFPIYSGGLGILAGDYCKAASDLNIPFVGVGLLYRQGYFIQTIDSHGAQIVHYKPTHLDDLPVRPALGAANEEVHVHVEFPGRSVELKVWQAQAGHITLLLLDSDLPSNTEEDRAITYQLYGGDKNTRIQQEIVLGIGGVRALDAMGLQPTVWHINEGHAAFQILERCRKEIAAGLDGSSALELVASGTVFTTHTPVAAGHDVFEHDLMERYFSRHAAELGIDFDAFLELGNWPNNDGGFNMTALALRGSRFHNGVSAIHGDVASHMESYVWPQISPRENPMGHVTNGIHVPTFLAREWRNLFDMRFRDWRNHMQDEAYWACIDDIPDHRFWSLRQELKSVLLQDVYERTMRRLRRNGVSKANIKRMVSNLENEENDILVLGFARRFATYKRAALLFYDPERLARLLNDPERPVLLIFAGKAHPSDEPGQHLIRVIHDFSQQPEFRGKVILLENFDMAMARKLVTGVDVWLNSPQYPLEASGTSGQKAGINGALNLSILDGWWAEGYNGENGWAIAPHGPEFDEDYSNREEANDFLEILENEVIPLYYDRDHQGYSAGWVRRSRESMKSIIPKFNVERMMMDYVRQLYAPAKEQHGRFAANGALLARQVAEWKDKVRQLWPGVSMARMDHPASEIKHDELLTIQVSTNLNGLEPSDVVLECLIGSRDSSGNETITEFVQFDCSAREAGGPETLFQLAFRPQHTGLQFYKIRLYPYREALCRRFETGCMLWL